MLCSMKKFQAAIEFCSQRCEELRGGVCGTITNDAVHRRFLWEKEESNKRHENDKNDEDDYYYCEQCNQRINAYHGKEELKSHFETVKHKIFSSCTYCRKPVYEYRYKKKIEVYRGCGHN